jgi:hypothetical protein
MLRKCFSNFYSYTGTKELPLGDAIRILIPYEGCIKQHLKYLKRISRDYGWETDDRSGEETYGYESDEQILNDLFYISDRFCAEFRLQWVLDLLDKHK